jgi:hypothetical protein
MKTKTCLVVDLLGFRQMITNLQQDEQRGRVIDWSEIVQQAISRSAPEHHLLVSDTLMVVSEDSVAGLEKLIKLSATLMNDGIGQSFLIRGAIARGEVAWEPGNIFGKAITFAYEFGQGSNWIGVSIHKSAETLAATLYRKDFLTRYAVPLKKGPAHVGPCVAWNIPEPYPLIGNSIANGLTPGEYIVQTDWAEKIENTLMFSAYNKIIGGNPLLGPEKFHANVPIPFIFFYEQLKAKGLL